MSAERPTIAIGELEAALDRLKAVSAADALDELVALHWDRLPMPGSGATLDRWRVLASIAAHDLSLAKLYEGHTDALAILSELGAVAAGEDSTWGVWAAEAPGGKALLERRENSVRSESGRSVLLQGGKCWCSGAASCSDALLTAWFADGTGPQLVSVRLDQPGVSVDRSGWHAIGMADSASLDVRFNDVEAELVGEPKQYLSRPGFWHGGAGIAACWYGGALAIAEELRRTVTDAAPERRGEFRLAALGKVDLTLQSTAALLRDAALWIDTHPLADASAVALRVRQSAESSARFVLDEAGRALGAAPYCRDSRFARLAADLPVFIRQSHAERDYAALGQRVANSKEIRWQL